MRTFFLTTFSFLILSSCSTIPKSEPPMVLLKKHDINIVSKHTKEVESYQEWLSETKKQLQNQYKDLQNLISKAKSKQGKTELEIDLQYKLVEKMTDMSMQILRLKNQMQKENEQHSMLSSILKRRNEASNEIIKNIK